MAGSEKQDRLLTVASSFLQYLAGELTAEWPDLARYLKISDAELHKIKSDNIGHEREAIYQMLIHWKRKEGPHATHAVLAEALWNANRRDLSYTAWEEEDRTWERLTKTATSSEKVKSSSKSEISTDTTTSANWFGLEDLPSTSYRKGGEHFAKRVVDASSVFDQHKGIKKLKTANDQLNKMKVQTDCTGETPRTGKKSMHFQDDVSKEGTNSVSSELVGKKKTFVKELRMAYRTCLSAIHPIPTDPEKQFSVEKIFVDRGIDSLNSDNSTVSRNKTGRRLCSYYDMFNDNGAIKPTRRILEGNVGCGKSIFTLQLAYDWTEQVPGSPVAKFEIFILLQCKKLINASTTARAVKNELLPPDSVIDENDVQEILDHFSGLIVVDSFEECFNQEISQRCDLNGIILGKQLKNFESILATRSSFLPKDYVSHTKLFKLNGFDEEAQDQYISKVALLENSNCSAVRIKKRLKHSIVVQALFHIPLFFAMFAHMASMDSWDDISLSVSKVFQHAKSCLLMHMHKKVNVKGPENFDQQSQISLHKLAFDSLCQGRNEFDWNKSDLQEKIGPGYYHKCIQNGFLYEENLWNNGACGHITKVKFIHSLFCQWFAAGYASLRIQREDLFHVYEVVDVLKPNDLHFIYRFICTVNNNSLQKFLLFAKIRGYEQECRLLANVERGGSYRKLPPFDRLTIINMCPGPFYTMINGDPTFKTICRTQLLHIASLQHE